MKVNEGRAYDRFLQTGSVTDYLSYVQAKHQTAPAAALAETDGESAYHNGRDCAAGAAHR